MTTLMNTLKAVLLILVSAFIYVEIRMYSNNFTLVNRIGIAQLIILALILVSVLDGKKKT